MRDQSVGILAELTNPERCSVHSKGQCAMSELVALDQTLSDPSLDPGLAPTCQAAALADDVSELLFDPDRLLERSTYG